MSTLRDRSRPSVSSDSELRTVELRPVPGVHAYDLWKNVTIGVWVGQATAAAVRSLLDVSAEMVRRHPEGRSSVVFVLDQLPAPTPEAQLLLGRVQESDGLACTALVLEGTGFWASGIRSMVNNVRRSATTDMTIRIHTTVDEVITWLPQVHLQRTGVTLPSDEFREVLLSVRTRGEARARLTP